MSFDVTLLCRVIISLTHNSLPLSKVIHIKNYCGQGMEAAISVEKNKKVFFHLLLFNCHSITVEKKLCTSRYFVVMAIRKCQFLEKLHWGSDEFFLGKKETRWNHPAILFVHHCVNLSSLFARVENQNKFFTWRYEQHCGYKISYPLEKCIYTQQVR